MLEMYRIILLLAILFIASIHDVKSREIPDYIWIAGGALGAMLYIFDWSDVNYFVILSVGVGGMIAFLIYRFFPMGDADALAILVTSIVCPVSFGVVMNPVVVFFGGLILEHFAAFFYNLRYNVEDLIRNRGIFVGMHNSWFFKVMAFYSGHFRRSGEKFTFCAESLIDGRRTISLKTPSAESDFETRDGVFVTWAMPAFPFMFIAFVLGLLFVGFV